VTVLGRARAAIHVQHWDAESKEFSVDASAADHVALRLFPYPAWKVLVNGQPVETSARADTGQMLVPVEAGMNRVEITFVRTWDRAVGGWISFVAGIGLLGWRFASRRIVKAS